MLGFFGFAVLCDWFMLRVIGLLLLVTLSVRGGLDVGYVGGFIVMFRLA